MLIYAEIAILQRMSDPAATFKRERAQDLWLEIMPLLVAHWREIAQYQDIPLDIDQAMYEQIEKSGFLRCYTARSPKHILIGYAVYFLKANPHYLSSKQATQDVLFLLPEHRRSRIGLQLIDYADSQLRLEGVQVVYQHSKIAHDIGPVLTRLGYEPIETIYARRLDR